MPDDAFQPYPMKLDPVFSPRPWGGDRLRAALGKRIPAEALAKGPIGETWELSDHPHGRSRVANGPLAGRLFGELYAAHPREMCGAERARSGFPLLVKYIDAAGDLSIQVHPDDAAARARGDRGKTECWYIMDCAPGAEVIYGLNDAVTLEALREGALSGRMEPLLRRRAIRPGSFLYLPAGTVHAILAGTLVCEVQQSSDLTYRLWDWDRQPARELHIEDAVAVSRYGAGNAPEIIDTADATGEVELASNVYFKVALLTLNFTERATTWRAEIRHGLIVNVVGGSGEWTSVEADHSHLTRGEFRLGETWFWPAGIASPKIDAGPQGLRLLLSQSLEVASDVA